MANPFSCEMMQALFSNKFFTWMDKRLVNYQLPVKEGSYVGLYCELCCFLAFARTCISHAYLSLLPGKWPFFFFFFLFLYGGVGKMRVYVS